MDTWGAAARVTAILAGVVFGSVAISSASWVWLRRQIFAYGGSALCGAGVILLGLSIWHSVKFGVTGTGLNLELSQLQREIKSDVATAVADNINARLAEYNDKISSETTDNINKIVQTAVSKAVEESRQGYFVYYQSPEKSGSGTPKGHFVYYDTKTNTGYTYPSDTKPNTGFTFPNYVYMTPDSGTEAPPPTPPPPPKSVPAPAKQP